MSEVTRLSIRPSESESPPLLETTVVESARFAAAERDCAGREERIEQQLLDANAAPRHVPLRELDPETSAEAKKDDKWGYEMPNREKFDEEDFEVDEDDGESVYSLFCREVQARRERRDERAALQARLDAEAHDSTGYVASLPAKIAQKRAEGRVRVDLAQQGATRRNNSPGGQLPEIQRRAIMLILVGKSDGSISYDLGVDRGTVWRWRQTEAFRVALFNAQRQVWGAGLNKIRAAVYESVGEMRKQLKDKKSSNNRFRAAQTLLYLAGLERFAPKMEENIDEEYLGDYDEIEQDRVA